MSGLSVLVSQAYSFAYCSETAIGEIINGKRRISTAMAWRLSKALGTTAEFWSNLQNDYDLLTFDPTSLGDIRPLITA